ncbi:substrate-binding domain-containing protein [Maribacter algicola]|uniref:Substrate-binding domain-containing protein n=1 Tax=Meishania litoralis TaxID=3434685 RepID=A0ACC7LF09_9FLAO
MGIKRIARLANVSIGTVDRVLHNRTGVSKETEKKVRKVIKEIGYTKNTTASRLKLASVKKIKFAVLIPETKNKWSYWKLPKKGIGRAVKELMELGVEVDYFEFLDSSTYKGLMDEIFLKDYDAIVTVAFFENESNELLDRANKKDIPVVFIDTEIELEMPANFVRQDSYKAGRVAGRLLNGLVGDKGCYFVVNMLNDRGIHANNVQRERGFRKFFEDSGQDVQIRTINYSLSGEFVVTKEMETWFATDDRKGIFVTNSKSHLLPRILEEYQVKNTFIVGFDLNKQNLKHLENGKIDFLINQQPRYQGYVAIKNLFNYLTKQDGSELNLDIPVEIMVKENIPFGPKVFAKMI